MSLQRYRQFSRQAAAIVLCLLVTAGLIPATLATPASAAPLPQTITTVEIPVVYDIGTIEKLPTSKIPNATYFVLHNRSDETFDHNFLSFDLSAIPADANVTGAALEIYMSFAPTGNTQTLEIGRVSEAWPTYPFNWNEQPVVEWRGSGQSRTGEGPVAWPLTQLVKGWVDGTLDNHGVAIRATIPNIGVFQGQTSEQADDPTTDDDGFAPRLVITYELPDDDGQPRPDLGDAPDSSNHHGQPNTAYPAAGVLGDFPTVWNVPAGQVAGPRHANQTMEGWLGNYLSRENEADQGPDQDAPPNNILRNSVTGAIADVADNDRGDDGWRNRNIRFFDCQRTTLAVRISKAPNATRNFMYLNVWFDGNRDGDWADLSPCQADEDEPAQASYEWIVQNYIVDMSAVPAGGAANFLVNTEKVLNSTPGNPHWMRFMLSEEPATQPVNGGLPDGRGPHPNSQLGAYKFGETEDVLQKPPQPGEDGELVLEKRVITDASPVPYADIVTYEIRLRHEGGSQPMQAQIRDTIEYPQHLLPRRNSDGNRVWIEVSSPTGGVAPLQATLDSVNRPLEGIRHRVRWNGVLAPDAEVILRFDVHVHPLCNANQVIKTITNLAEARPKNGDPISAEATFPAACAGFSPGSIDIDPEPIENPVIDLDDLTSVPWRGRLHNRHAFSVTLGAVFEPNDEPAANPQIIDRVTLAPNEERLVNLALRMDLEITDALQLSEDFMPGGNLSFCFLTDLSGACPDAEQYPDLTVEAPPVEIHYRPSDLGDAPDSTNHAGVAMTAYNGVQAEYPTVFDPNTGLPPGPRHQHPRPFHLGRRVSQEAEADIGPDQDPLNNIIPAANDPDNDRADDGTNFALWNLNNCQTTNLPVQVFISPQAVNYFQQLGTSGYLNIWLDSNRDGDWADTFPCNVAGGQQPAPEHIVIDFPVDVVGLGAGLHNLPVPTGLIPWSNNQRPSWVRITLSELESNKTLLAGDIKYGDGRGYPNGFKTGETEDYFYRPTTAGGGPDIDVQMTAHTRRMVDNPVDRFQAASAELLQFEIQLFQIDYGNVGSATAEGGVLIFKKSSTLQDAQLRVLQAPGINTNQIQHNGNEIRFPLGKLTPNAFGRITLGWTGCLTCTVAASVNADITADVEVTLAGDVDTSNNQSSATARGLLSSPIIGLQMPSTTRALCNNEVIYGVAVTNRTVVDLVGEAAPNQTIIIRDGAREIATVQSDSTGNFSQTATLAAGRHMLTANYVDSPRDAASGLATGPLRLLVNPSLPFDPSSLCFVDSQDNAFPLPTLGMDKTELLTPFGLRPGEPYQVVVSGLSDQPNQRLTLSFTDLIVSSLTDTDRDGVYVGTITMPERVQSAGAGEEQTVTLQVNDGFTESSYETAVAMPTTAIITNRITGQPLANATVTLLQATDVEDGAAVYRAYAERSTQVTGADGQYSFLPTSGTTRIDVVLDGYQPYRSTGIASAVSGVNQNIAVTPAIAAAATQTVYLTANGVEPAMLSVTPGSVVEFVNVDLDEHGVTGDVGDSGSLVTGASYKVQFDDMGTFRYHDSTDATAAGQITVEPSSLSPTTVNVFLPLVTR